MEIVQPQRDPLWTEQILITTLLANGNRRIETCGVIEQVQGRGVAGINGETNRPQRLEIGLPWRMAETIRTNFSVTPRLCAATFDKAFQDPA